MPNHHHRLKSATGAVVACVMLLSGCSTGPFASGEPADLALASEPSADATELDVLVMERACASGRPADGRMSLDDVEVTPSEVRLQVSVRGLDGDQDCQGNPWTPLTVQLDTEVGDRVIVDANESPATPLEVVDLSLNRAFERSLEQSLELLRSWQPPDTYELTALAECYCPATRYRLEVVAGEVVERAAVDEATSDAEALRPEATPSLQELRERILDDPARVRELAVADDGALLFVALDPDPDVEEDDVLFTIEEIVAG